MLKNSTKVSRRVLAASVVAAAACVSSPAVFAEVICGPTANLPVPQNIDGFYLNLVTGANDSSGADVSGWDVNMYQTGAAALYFFWPSTPAGNFGGVSVGSVYSALDAGVPVTPASTFSIASGSGGAANFVNWQTANTGKYLGVRFFNEATSSVNYGWIQLDTGAAGGFPATLIQYCYQNDGTQIQTGGTVPVELQGFSVD